MKTMIVMAFCVLFVGCGTIINGGNECIEVTSEYGQTQVYIDGQSFTTPAKVNLDRTETHTVSIGGQTVQIEPEFSPWTLANIPMFGLFGGAIGILIDTASGGASNLEPDKLVYRNGQIIDKENGAVLVGGEWIKDSN